MITEEMFASLAPKKNEFIINDYKFYARPLTVSEFAEYCGFTEQEDRNYYMILKAVVEADGSQIFDSVEQIKALWPDVQFTLLLEASKMSVRVSPREIEESLK